MSSTVRTCIPLEGFIEYRWNLGTCSTAGSRKKTKFESNQDVLASSKQATSRTGDGGSIIMSSLYPEAGFYLVLSNDEASTSGKTLLYLLSIPHNLLKTVCDAARFRFPVRVSSYHIVSISKDPCSNGAAGTVGDDDTDGYSKKRTLHATKSTNYNTNSDSPLLDSLSLLEVHPNGLQWISTSAAAAAAAVTLAPPASSMNEFLSLQQVYCREHDLLVHDDDDNDTAAATATASGQQLQKTRKQRHYNLKGMVDSISPILYMENDNEPFALMELYDNNNDQDKRKPYSCVIVFQGIASLICHEGILPGDSIQLRHAKRQQWKMPEEVQKHQAWHLKHRVPSHVFVVKDAKNVIWRHNNCNNSITTTSTDDDDDDDDDDDAGIPSHNSVPPMPSTPIPLVSLQGRVVSRKWASRGNQASYMIHSLELEPLYSTTPQHGTNKRYVLFLLYFPMSPAMTLSLRRGALIQAINIHPIASFQGFEQNSGQTGTIASVVGHTSTTYYGACLRSTVTILQMPEPPSPCDTSSSSPSPSFAAVYPSRPFHMKTVQQTYLEYAWRHQIYRWYHHDNNFTNITKMQLQENREENLPSLDDIVKTFCGMSPLDGTNISNGKVCARNPYLEFLDHACEKEEEKGQEQLWPTDVSESECADKDEMQHPKDEIQHPRNGCPCSWESETGMDRPCWISLHKLRHEGFRTMEGRLAGLGRGSHDPRCKPQIGWTCSLLLTSAELYQNLVDPGTLEHCRAPILFTGGLTTTNGSRSEEISVAATSRHVLASVSLQNDQCVLPATTIQKRPWFRETPASFSRKHSVFAIGALHSIVVSAVCVGVAVASSIDAKSITGDTKKKGGGDADFKKPGVHGSSLPLPRQGDEIGKNKPSSIILQGACSLFHSEGLVFVISIQLLFTALMPVVDESSSDRQREAAIQFPKKSSNVNFDPPGEGTTLRRFTIQQCLDPDENANIVNTQNGRVVGLYVRQRLRQSKIVDNRYGGCVLTISHIPMTNSSAGCDGGQIGISSTQCIEVKSTVHVRNAVQTRDQLRREIMALLQSTSYTDLNDAATMALAWWQIAENPDTCPLTAGGWDDLVGLPSTISQSHAENAWCVIVQLPSNVVQGPDARGYQRFGCSMSQIRARFLFSESNKFIVNVSPTRKHSSASLWPSSFLTTIGGHKFLPGNLDRRPLRCEPHMTTISVVGQGKLLPPPCVGRGAMIQSPRAPISGIPECTIVDLLRAICLDLQNKQFHGLRDNETCNNPLAPSFVRRVVGARFLGASYCQAQAICSKCFQPLCQPKGSSHIKEHHRKSGVAKCKQKDLQRTFWHLPMPVTDMKRGTSPESFVLKEVASTGLLSLPSTLVARYPTTLVCPKGCLVEAGEIKWECSGTLDDGTGQAKLYAEREAATMLLGLSPTTIAMVEEGVWRSKTGSIVYTKTVPPPSHIAKAVEAANVKVNARESDRRRHVTSNMVRECSGAANDKMNELLQEMGAVDRGCYVMIQECRKSHRKSHRMDFLVRCKPLADTAVHLNHTEVDFLAPGKFHGSCSVHLAATYTLPPLKLNLVDCSISTSEPIEETWDLVRSLHSNIELH